MNQPDKYAGADWLQDSLQYHPGTRGKVLSPFARQVADILGQVFRGLYHIPGVAGMDWFSMPEAVFITLSRELATYDGWELSALVVLCHDAAIRLGVAAVIEPWDESPDAEAGAETGALYDALREFTDAPGECCGSPRLRLSFHRRAHAGRRFCERHLTMEQTVAAARELGRAIEGKAS